MAIPADSSTKPGPKRRSKQPVPYKGPLPVPPEPVVIIPLHRRPWVILLGVAALLVIVPVLVTGWNLLRPDAAPAATRAAASPATGALDRRLLDLEQKLATLRRLHPEYTDAIATGAAYEAGPSLAFVRAAVPLVTEALANPGPDAPTDRVSALRPADGVLRAQLATLRAPTLTEPGAAALRATHLSRLDLAALRIGSADTPAAWDAALDHAADVLTELRADVALLLPGMETDPALLHRLASLAQPAASARSIPARFDAALDLAPDTALSLMTGPDKGPLVGNTTFEKLARIGRRPNAHREKIAALHRQFGAALAKHTFAEAIRELDPADHRPQTVHLASMFLREQALERLGGDNVVGYFYAEVSPPAGELEQFLMKFTTLAKADDPFGESLLLHRRASLARLLARQHRFRFDAAATVYVLALELRRARAADGKWPKDTIDLLDGLLDSYPQDPFTGEPVAYSRKRLHLRSPGADSIDRGGLDEPEYASTLAQLWEPTLPLEPEKGPSPAAFGLRLSDFDKPVPRPWERPWAPPR